ncbi:MAG: YfiR family protein, partial [Bryobacteraceae bacterium]|nr:YfiR family protein [Bryobacteraceae bacterium]
MEILSALILPCIRVTLRTVLLLSVAVACQAREALPHEEDVKAAFVLNFIRFVEWNPAPEERDRSILPVCALADGPVIQAFTRLSAGKVVGGRTIRVHITSEPAIAGCRVLVVEPDHYAKIESTLKNLLSAPLLTIGCGPGFTRLGGMFQLLPDGSRVQFEARLDAISAAGLQVSPSLLRL